MRNILRQSSFLFIAQGLTKLISFIYIIYLVRVLGVSEFGLYSVALAYFAIISSVADFGFNRFLIREVAKNQAKSGELMWNILMFRLTLISILFAVFSIFLYSLDSDQMRVGVALLATLAVLPQSAALTFDAIYVAVQKLQFSAVALFTHVLLIALTGFILVNSGFGVIGAVSALIFGQVVYALVLLLFLYRHKKFILSSVQISTVRKIIAGSLPYGLLGVLGLLYFKIDTILLSYLRGNFEAGIYGAAYKFLEAIVFVPGAFAAALFPVLAKMHDKDKAGMKKLYFKSLKFMGEVGIVLFLVYILVLPEVIKIFLPNYLPAIEVIKILSFAIPFIFLATPGVQVLFSSEKYLKTVIFLSVFTLAFNVILNLIFIPLYGFLAAAYITVASDILSFVIFYTLIIKRIFR